VNLNSQELFHVELRQIVMIIVSLAIKAVNILKTIWFIYALAGILMISSVGCSEAITSETQSDSSPQLTENFPVDNQPTKAAAETASENKILMTPAFTLPIDSGLHSLVDQAKADLAQRLSISVDQIELVEAKAVTWPDASLGCPQPGMLYKQVPEDGALMILQAQERIYEYHSGGSRGLFLCEKLLKDPNPPPRLDLNRLTPYPLDKTNPTLSTPDNSIPPGEDE
jgi:hypothetical protein